MITEATLEWDRLNLYRVSGTRREFVGTVVRDSFEPVWTVWLRGEAINQRFPTEAAAKSALEKYA